MGTKVGSMNGKLMFEIEKMLLKIEKYMEIITKSCKNSYIAVLNV